MSISFFSLSAWHVVATRSTGWLLTYISQPVSRFRVVSIVAHYPHFPALFETIGHYWEVTGWLQQAILGINQRLSLKTRKPRWSHNFVWLVLYYAFYFSFRVVDYQGNSFIKESGDYFMENIRVISNLWQEDPGERKPMWGKLHKVKTAVSHTASSAARM